MIRPIPILILLLSFSAAASPRPTPIPGERTSEFTDRYYAWLDTIPAGDRAWEEMQRIDAVIQEALDEFGGPTSNPNDGEQWVETIRFIEQNSELLEAIRLNASKPELGLQITEHKTDNLNSATETAMGILLPHLSMIRNQSELLAASMIHSNNTDTKDLFIKNATAIRNLSRMIPVINTTIEYLIFLGNTDLLMTAIRTGSIDLDNRTDNQLNDLIQLFGDSEAHMQMHNAVSFEHFGALDILEYLYEDSADGELTHDGAKRLSSLLSVITSETPTGKLAKRHHQRAASYDEQRAFIASQITLMEKDLATPPHELSIFASEESMNSVFTEPGMHSKLFAALFTLPRISKMFKLHVEQHTKLNATRLNLAAHRHKLTHGSFPASLKNFDPTILTFTPTDLFTGQPLHYKIVDGQPLIYSNGTDRDDDNAAPAEAHEFIPHDKLNEILESDPASIDGDWILYPATRD